MLRSLVDGWDSYRGKPISNEAIATVSNFAAVPCSDGGIQMEIHQDGIDIEICINPDGTIGTVLVGRSPTPQQ